MTAIPWKLQKKTGYPLLKGDIAVEAAIIGGGITGVTACYLLAKQGVQVALFEAETIGGGGDTGHTTAFLTEIIDTNLSDLVSIFGKKAAKEILASHQDAISFIEETAEKEHIDCEFIRVPIHIYATTNNQVKVLKEETDAGKLLGLEGTYTDKPPLPFETAAAYTVNHQAKFHPLRYIEELALKAEEYGALIFEHSKAVDIDHEKLGFTCNGKRVSSEWILSATHTLLDSPLRLYFTKGTYYSYVHSYKIEKDLMPEALYEDLENPYHYMRVDKKDTFDRLIIGGEDHRADIPLKDKSSEEALSRYAQSLFPNSSLEKEASWKGYIIEPVDGLAFIGPEKEGSRVIYATGYSGNGMTYGTIAAHMFLDYVQESPVRHKHLYDSLRTPSLKALAVKGKDYVGELAHGAARNLFP